MYINYRFTRFLYIYCLIFSALLLANPAFGIDWTASRKAMVENDLRGRGISEDRVLTAMEKVKRHLFVPLSMKLFSYADRPLPIGEGQTISQPYIVALMTQLLNIDEGMKVLEIGTGSGYQAAILEEMGCEVYTIEIIPLLAKQTARLFKEMKLPIMIKNADGYFGWKEYGPFDRIIITAAANHIPRPLLNQLKPGGKLILPLGNIRYYQTLTLVNIDKNGKTSVEHHGAVRFVPMTGKMIK